MKTVGACGCAGISWRSFFLYCPTCCQPEMKGIRYSKVLTLDDLDEMTPVYIGCVTNNQWRRTTSPREQDSEILTMSPHNIERLDRPKREEELHGKLTPMDIYLSDATATSAAAINHQMGTMQADDGPFKDLKVMLGLSCGTSIVSDQRHEKERHFCIQINNSFKYLFLYLPTFSGSNAWDFHLVKTGISGNVPATSEDFWQLSEDFRTLPKMSGDVWRRLGVLWFR